MTIVKRSDKPYVYDFRFLAAAGASFRVNASNTNEHTLSMYLVSCWRNASVHITEASLKDFSDSSTEESGDEGAVENFYWSLEIIDR